MYQFVRSSFVRPQSHLTHANTGLKMVDTGRILMVLRPNDTIQWMTYHNDNVVVPSRRMGTNNPKNWTQMNVWTRNAVGNNFMRLVKRQRESEKIVYFYRINLHTYVCTQVFTGRT